MNESTCGVQGQCGRIKGVWGFHSTLDHSKRKAVVFKQRDCRPTTLGELIVGRVMAGDKPVSIGGLRRMLPA